jgi:hypothetical protein
MVLNDLENKILFEHMQASVCLGRAWLHARQVADYLKRGRRQIADNAQWEAFLARLNVTVVQAERYMALPWDPAAPWELVREKAAENRMVQ